MIFIVVIAGGVIAVALLHLAVGWRIATGLHQGALAVTSRAPDVGARVRSVSRGEIVLEAPEPRQDIGHPGVMGLSWEGGYGQVGEVLAVRDSRITREWHESGSQPPICDGPLDGCPPLALESYAFPIDPTDRGLSFEEIEYTGPLGEMTAWKVAAGNGDRWAILCHGWTAEKRELLRMLPSFHDAGLTSMVIDYRNDVGQPIDPTGRHRFGLSEWEDLEAAVRHASAGGAESITLMGCSTGGALVMQFLERSRLASLIDGVVLDAPNVVLADTFRHAVEVGWATPLMFEFGLWLADLRWKVDWEATNLVDRAPSFLTMPTLIFHGTSDRTVPISESRQLAARVPGNVELIETQAAGHVMSWNANPERYERYLRSFLASL